MAAVASARDRRRDEDAVRISGDVIPVLAEMRPTLTWETVARFLAKRGSKRPDGGDWTGAALARVTRRLVRSGLVDAVVLDRTPRKRDNDDLVTLVAMAAKTLPEPTLANIAAHLEGLHVRTAAGGWTWRVSSVRNLLQQAVEAGLLGDRPMPKPDAPRRRGRPAKSMAGS